MKDMKMKERAIREFYFFYMYIIIAMIGFFGKEEIARFYLCKKALHKQ